VPPPRRRPREAHQAGGLGRHAVGGHELLLLAKRAEEAERVRAKADQPHGRQREERQCRAHQHGSPLTPVPGRQHHERQHHPRHDLHAHACDHGHRTATQAARARAIGAPVRPRGPRRAFARPAARRQRQRERHRSHHERVVVGPAERQLEQHRVQPHERHRPLRRSSQRAGGVAHQRDRPEARDGGDRLHRPQAAGDAQRRERVAAEREQGPVGGVLEGPPDEREHRVGGRFGREVRVRVQPVQGPQAGVAEVAEHVLGDQRRPQQQDHVRGHDRRHQRPHRQRPRPRQHERVADAHQQRQVLEAVAAQRRGQAPERPRQPRGPAPDAGGDVLRGCAGGACAQKQHARQDPEQAECSQRPCPARSADGARRAATPSAAAGDAHRRYRGGRLQGVHSAPYPAVARSCAPAKVLFKLQAARPLTGGVLRAPRRRSRPGRRMRGPYRSWQAASTSAHRARPGPGGANAC